MITVPAYFTDSQRQATREAGEIAGLEVIRIINEPTAAALAYERTRSEPHRILVFDLGGGTFDVSIVKIEDGVVEVLSSTGDNRLGGDDFDQKIVARLLEHIQKELKLSVVDNPVVMARLTRAAEAAKITLSSEPYVKIEEDHIGKKGPKNVHLSYELSRMDFEEMLADDLTRMMDSVKKALEDADLLPSTIDKIILVGGSTRIPSISRMLEEKFSHLPHSEIDPDLCVALGAAIQAGREMGLKTTSILLDITPYTFGTSALGQVDGVPCISMFVPLIRRNTKLPASRSEAFQTLYENQEAVEITVYQGENPDALDNVLIGKYLFKLNNAPAGSVMILKYHLDLNGILKIQAIEKRTGKQIHGVIENAISRFTEHELSDSKQKIEELWHGQQPVLEDQSDAPSEEDDSGKRRMPADIAAIIRQAETQLDSASPEDRDEIINLVEDIRDAVKEDRMEDADAFKRELEDILFYVG